MRVTVKVRDRIGFGLALVLQYIGRFTVYMVSFTYIDQQQLLHHTVQRLLLELGLGLRFSVKPFGIVEAELSVVPNEHCYLDLDVYAR